MTRSAAASRCSRRVVAALALAPRAARQVRASRCSTTSASARWSRSGWCCSPASAAPPRSARRPSSASPPTRPPGSTTAHGAVAVARPAVRAGAHRRWRRWRSALLTLRLGGHFLPLSHHRLGPVDRAAVRQHRCPGPPHRDRRTSRRCAIGRWSLVDAARDVLPDLGARRRWPALFCHNVLQSRTGPRDPQPARRRDAAGQRRRRCVPRAPHAVRLAALLAGLAGWLYAHMNRFVSPSPFDVRASIEYLLMAVAGGLGHLAARWSARPLVLLLKNGLQDVLPLLTQRGGQLEAVAFAMLFIVLLHHARGGLMGFVRALDARPLRARRRTPRRDASVEPLAAPRAAGERHAVLLAVDRRGQALRRPGRRQRRQLRRARRRDRRPDRAQRRRQVDDVQPAHRHAADDRRPGRVPRPRHHRPVAASTSRGWAWRAPSSTSSCGRT